MQYVVPFEGGSLNGMEMVWEADTITHRGEEYRTVYHGPLKIPRKYVLFGPSQEEKETIPGISSRCLTIPLSIYKVETARQDKILLQLQAFVNSAVDKYIRGQQEHGGKLEDRPCFDEMHNEILDLMWYWYAEKERRDNNR